jgi:hypothetical protein
LRHWFFVAWGWRSVYRTRCQFCGRESFLLWRRTIVYRDLGWIESQIIFIAGGWRSVYRDSLSNFWSLNWIEALIFCCMRMTICVPGLAFNFVVGNHFYCGRRTIGVPDLGWIESQIIFIAGGWRSVYRLASNFWSHWMKRRTKNAKAFHDKCENG